MESDAMVCESGAVRLRSAFISPAYAMPAKLLSKGKYTLVPLQEPTALQVAQRPYSQCLRNTSRISGRPPWGGRERFSCLASARSVALLATPINASVVNGEIRPYQCTR